MIRLSKGLAFAAMSLSLAILPAQAQFYNTYPGNPYGAGYGYVQPAVSPAAFQSQLNDLRARISSATASGRLGPSDGQNLQQGVDIIVATIAHQSSGATGMSPEQANAINLQISSLAQRVDTLVGMTDAQRSLYGGGRLFRRPFLGGGNYWR